MGRKAKSLTGDVIESFFGVYLLVSASPNPRYKGRTYIGFTVDPNRRIQQHNLGKEKGGAWRTSDKGPWDMVLIIHGFPNEISALRFEWAWQHPQRSRRLRNVTKKTRKESSFEFALRVVSQMLCVGPWCRLPLSIRWLLPDRAREFPAGNTPPMHMAICYGPVVSKKISSKEAEEDLFEEFSSILCYICKSPCPKETSMQCLLKDCDVQIHTSCLAEHFLRNEKDHFIPVEGSCPKCFTTVLWGDLVRKKKGCYQQLGEDNNVCNISDFMYETLD